jgi:hypothetical protein
VYSTISGKQLGIAYTLFVNDSLSMQQNKFMKIELFERTKMHCSNSKMLGGK